jgi:hypothetical protein
VDGLTLLRRREDPADKAMIVMDNSQNLLEIVKIAQDFLDNRRSALQTAVGITGLGLVHLLCWETLGGIQGPLSSLYAAADDAEKHFFLGDDVEKWHDSVLAGRRAALAESEEFWAADVQTACEALIAYAVRKGLI